MSDETIKRDALKSWLRSRLTEGERPKQEWRQLCEASWDQLLATRAHDLIDAEAIKALADRLSDPDLISELSRPVVAGIARAVIAELRQADQPIDQFLPSEAHEKLRETIGRPGLVDPDLIHATFRGEAVEGVLNDALYRALKDFSTLLPRMLVKVSPMGRFGVLGGAGALAERLIDELEKLIEPEIKTFLADSTGRVLERAAAVTIDRLDEPASIDFRINVMSFMLSKSPAFHLKAVDEELLGDLAEVVELTARHVADMPELRSNIEEWIDRAIQSAEGKTIGEILQPEGARARPPLDAVADATWPVFSTLLTGPHARSWLDTLVDELLDEYERVDD